MSERFFLGLSPTIHDPSLALVDATGEVIFAEALERPLQDKRSWHRAPDHLVLIKDLLDEHCGSGAHVDVGVSWSRGMMRRMNLMSILDDPFLAPWLGRLTHSVISRRDHQAWPMHGFLPLVRAMGTNLRQTGANLQWLKADWNVGTIHYFDHHLTHAVSAVNSVQLTEAAVAVVDGFGESGTSDFFRLADGELHSVPKKKRWSGEASLGTFYASVTWLCGFDPVRGEEWKMMGLAPYGKVRKEFMDALGDLFTVRDLSVVQAVSGREQSARFDALAHLIHSPNPAHEDAADLAATAQQIFADNMRALLTSFHAVVDNDNLVLTGGCALNSAYNGRVLSETPFSTLCVPSAPGDDGNAIGAAQLARRAELPQGRLRLGPLTPFLGTHPQIDVLERLKRFGGLDDMLLTSDNTPERAARLLAEGAIVGWMTGAAEFGPRALGHRSILADARDPQIKEKLNSTVKFREAFRPFAPMILEEFGDVYFENFQPSPYMERALLFREERRAEVPGVVHVDGTGRLQTVNDEFCPRTASLLRHFHELTGTPILLNTSLNRMGKPIVHSLEDGLALFLTSGLDALAIEDVLLVKPGAHVQDR